MKKHLFTTLSALAVAVACLPVLAHSSETGPDVTGHWISTPGASAALHGYMALREDGSATLAPQGFAPLQGTWTLRGTQLSLNMPPHGTSVSEVARDGNVLTLLNEGGIAQTFVLDLTHPEGEAP